MTVFFDLYRKYYPCKPSRYLDLEQDFLVQIEKQLLLCYYQQYCYLQIDTDFESKNTLYRLSFYQQEFRPKLSE